MPSSQRVRWDLNQTLSLSRITCESTASVSSVTMSRVVLFFLHGGSFTKECWKPIIRRLEHAPLIQQLGCDFHAVDWQLHGEKSDHSTQGVLEYHGKSPRMQHYLREWTKWGPPDIKQQVDSIRRQRPPNTKLVGIGHSMGGSTLINVETTTPGSFDGLIAFEPVHDDGITTEDQWTEVIDMLVTVTSKRPYEWNSMEDVRTYFTTDKMYRKWHPESVDAFLEHGVVHCSDGKYRLATLPSQEASLYCHDKMRFDLAKLKCKLFLEHGTRSPFFNAGPTRQLVSRFPETCFMGEAIPNTSHSMVLEDPDTCADRILTDLAQMFDAPSSSRL